MNEDAGAGGGRPDRLDRPDPSDPSDRPGSPGGLGRRLRPEAWIAAAVLALLAYVPALTAAPGRMPGDSKLYLYLDPGRFLGDAASSFDPRQFAGWVPHQHIAYLWPAGPWFWVFDVLGVPDWIAHRLWIGTLMVAAGLGVRWCARLLGLAPLAALVAALVYQLSLYVLPYVSRTSVMLLPWAGLGWIVGFTVRATRRRTWGDPAAIALLVFTVGAVNATALAMIVPAPLLWLVHATWQRALTWRQAAAVAGRVVVLTVPVCVWWVAMLLIQGRYGAEVLPYSESLADVSLTSTGPEVWRSLGYWLFYVRDLYAATTTESLRYLVSTWSIVISYAVPILCLAGLVWVRWVHRRFAGLLVAAGALLAVGVHPLHDRSPLMRVVAGEDDRGLALALRSSTRALPVMNLGLALLAGSLVAAASQVRWRRSPRWRGDAVAAAVIGAVVVVNLPSLWTGAFVDPALERDQDPPAAWRSAAEALDADGDGARVLQLPGAEFGAFTWGYTVDQPLPGLTETPLVTRDLLPLGSPAAMDLLYALDDRIQDGSFEASSLAPIARWLGVDTVWLANDLSFDRFRTARPHVLRALLEDADGLDAPTAYGDSVEPSTRVAMIDEAWLGSSDARDAVPPVELYPVASPGSVVRAKDRSVVVSGSGDGLVDLAAAGLLDGEELVRYSAALSSAELAEALESASDVLVTDSNRDRARHWRSSQDVTGYTESDQPGLDLLREVASDARLPVFAERDEPVDPATQTVARQVGPVRATATSYGEPFAYLPEHRPYMAIDGDPATAWLGGRFGDPLGETLRLRFDRPVSEITLVQPLVTDDRRITAIEVRDLDGGWAPVSMPLSGAAALSDPSLGPADSITLPAPSGGVDITITAVGGGLPGRDSAVAGVGFAEVMTGLEPTIEVVRVPTDATAVLASRDSTGVSELPLTFALTRLRVDPMDRWRSDPEPVLVREIDVPAGRTLDGSVEVRVDRRATDESLAALFGWPAWGSSRLTGSVASAGVSAIDGALDTSWITAFGEALGATLTVDGVTQPIGSLVIHQPVGEFSRITELVVRSGGDERIVTLPPAGDGSPTEVALEPALPPGRLEIEISGVDSNETVDRRSGNPVQLPAAIAEIEFDGRPTAADVASAQAHVPCRPLVTASTSDGGSTPGSFTVDVTGRQAIDGESVLATPCDGALQVTEGTWRVEALPVGLPIDVDRIVLTDRQPSDQQATGGADGTSATSAASAMPSPNVRVVDDGRFRRTFEISGCDEGCWLVFGEGYSEAWTARGPDGSLGDPQLVDGGFNGWWIEPSSEAVRVTVEWTQQGPLRIAMAVSAIGVLLAAALLVLDRRRHSDTVASRTEVAPTLTARQHSIPTRPAVVLAVVWCVSAAVLIAPQWALAGAVAGAVVVALRRVQIVPLTAWAIVVLVGALVTIRERRNSPPPDGGWPTVFESWHRLAMFAVVTVLVAAVFADEAGLEVGSEHEWVDAPDEPASPSTEDNSS